MENSIAILCVNAKSVYKKIQGVDCWDEKRDAYNYAGQSPIIAHPPCAQWSRLHHFAHKNEKEKGLALHCFKLIQKYGGILEHPAGSKFFKAVGVMHQVISIDQHWFGYPARKRTYLYFNQCKPVSFPLNFNAVEKKVNDMSGSTRSKTTQVMAEWLIRCIRETHPLFTNPRDYYPGYNFNDL